MTCDHDHDHFNQELKFQHSRESGHGQGQWSGSKSLVSRSQKILQFNFEQLLMKYYCYIPDSAIRDIINPTFSVYWIKDNEADQANHRHGFKGVWHKNKHRPIIDNWEIYIPKGAFRLYIHMVNYKYRYEVTWIIDKEKYVGRVIDKLE